MGLERNGIVEDNNLRQKGIAGIGNQSMPDTALIY
jgi:hypothetical protein